MLGLATRVRRRWAPDGFSVPVAPWVRLICSWAGRRPALAVLRESLELSTDQLELSHTRVFTLGYPGLRGR